MKTARKTSAVTRQHAWDRAKALGWAAAESGKFNPYPRGSYCAVIFDLEKSRAFESSHPVRSNVPAFQIKTA